MLFNCFELLRGVPGGTPGEGQLLKILDASFAGYSTSFWSLQCKPVTLGKWTGDIEAQEKSIQVNYPTVMFFSWKKKVCRCCKNLKTKQSLVEVNTIFRRITMSVVSAEETTAMPLYSMHSLPIFVLGLVKVKRWHSKTLPCLKYDTIS